MTGVRLYLEAVPLGWFSGWTHANKAESALAANLHWRYLHSTAEGRWWRKPDGGTTYTQIRAA